MGLGRGGWGWGGADTIVIIYYNFFVDNIL